MQRAVEPDDVGREALRRYRQVTFLGKGAFAEVYEHADGASGGARVAIKRVLKDAYRSGVNLGAIKELQALCEARGLRGHPNVLALLDAFPYGDRMHLVLEFAVTDLTAVLREPSLRLNEAHAKGWALQLLAGLTYLHRTHVLHRDLKPDNVLVTSDGVLKIADFGHATRFPGVGDGLHHRVVTVWYRAPELLLGARVFGPALDVWCCGWIRAELVLKRPLLPGRTEAEQLELIFRLLGTPTDAAWPGWDRLPLARELRMRPRAPANLRSALGLDAAAPYGAGAAAHVSEAGLDLLRAMLALDPARRISAADARSHPWFAESPLPLDPRLMPSFPDPTDAAAAAK
jgi:cyclin-dependent kinase 7